MAITDQFSPLHSSVDDEGKPHKRKLADLSKEEMHKLVDSLEPRKKMLAGMALFHRIIDETYSDDKKCAAFLEFMEKARTLAPTGELNRYDFTGDPDETPEDKYVLGHTKHLENLPMTRRSLIRYGAIAGLAAVESTLAIGFNIYGLAQTVRSLNNKNTASKEPVSNEWYEKVVHEMDKNWWGPMDMLIGGAFGVDAGLNISKILREREEEIFWQISNAVSEFCQEIDYPIALGTEQPSHKRKSRS
jgi:hypothetical protein